VAKFRQLWDGCPVLQSRLPVKQNQKPILPKSS
jgi:hypothetical protein